MWIPTELVQCIYAHVGFVGIGNLRSVKKLLRIHKYVKVIHTDLESAFNACWHGDVEFLQFMQKLGWDFYMHRYSILEIAPRNRCRDIYEFVFGFANFTLEEVRENNLLIDAINKGHPEVVKFLLEDFTDGDRRLDVHDISKAFYHLFVSYNAVVDYDVVKILCEHRDQDGDGVRLTDVIMHDYMCFLTAISKRQLNVFKLLLDFKDPITDEKVHIDELTMKSFVEKVMMHDRVKFYKFLKTITRFDTYESLCKAVDHKSLQIFTHLFESKDGGVKHLYRSWCELLRKTARLGLIKFLRYYLKKGVPVDAFKFIDANTCPYEVRIFLKNLRQDGMI